MRYLFLTIGLFWAQLFFAQTNKTSLFIDRFRFAGEGNGWSLMPVCETEVASAFMQYGGFSVLDRRFTDKVDKELERQKSEQFMDGKVVEQGKAIGAEYIVTGNYDFSTWLLQLQLVKVASQEVTETVSRKVDFTAPSQYYKKQVKDLVFRLAGQLLAQDNILVVRALETKKNEAQTLLIAAGSGKGIKEGQTLELYQVEVEQVGEEAMERFVQIGEVKIEKVENANFSQAKVKKGGELTLKLLNEKKEVFCKKSTN